MSLKAYERVAVLNFLRESIPFVRGNLEPEVEVDCELLPVMKQWEKFSEANSN